MLKEAFNLQDVTVDNFTSVYAGEIAFQLLLIDIKILEAAPDQEGLSELVEKFLAGFDYLISLPGN